MPPDCHRLYAECQQLYQQCRCHYNSFFQAGLQARRLQAEHAAAIHKMRARYQQQLRQFDEQAARTRLTFMIS